MGSEALDFFSCDNNGFCYEPKKNITIEETENLPIIHDGSWFEEEIDVDLKWSFALNRYIYYLSISLRIVTSCV